MFGNVVIEAVQRKCCIDMMTKVLGDIIQSFILSHVESIIHSHFFEDSWIEGVLDLALLRLNQPGGSNPLGKRGDFFGPLDDLQGLYFPASIRFHSCHVAMSAEVRLIDAVTRRSIPNLNAMLLDENTSNMSLKLVNLKLAILSLTIWR
mmetsp:Transcript_996/g.1889  ORF Transcript_996/g.1889 Transcript_996/m.1889 type:complete len:149 (-) Transcript_996:963-1409(-)